MVSSAITHVLGAVPTTTLPDGEPIPVLGQGTWHMAEDARRWQEEISALRVGIDLGLNLIDTAEMYADGRAEELVGEAIAGRRDDVFLVSKVLPEHATKRGTVAACERSLRRIKTDRLDLYLLHWREDVPLEATLEGFEALIRAGMIRHWGVSNFDVSDMEELERLPGGTSVATDQVLYNLTRRGIEWDLLPWCRARRIPVMAYSPIEQGRMLKHPVLRKIATRHGVTPAQVALAWLLRQELLCAIPKAATPEHVRENRAALEVRLTDQDLAELDRAFPPPDGPRPLEML
ncbi:MAG TPA: aldo/keto reductase [Gemmatimonadales bacterium]|jgi:diketogulonate reductase-like aldo/keto reductase|nr:aldo/keto reductase [Gemmatimonadales bacterium]